MLSNNAFAIYTFTHHRYIFKRLVGGLHLVTAGCVYVTMEVLTSSIDEWNIEVSQKAREFKDWNFSSVETTGSGWYLALSVVFIYLFACVVFFISSHKQKGSRAATTELEIEDRPVYIGR
jgi:hypothetical protein